MLTMLPDPLVAEVRYQGDTPIHFPAHSITFPAAEHHYTLAGIKLYSLATEAQGEQLAQSFSW